MAFWNGIKLGAQGDASGAEGVLVRKHDWENTTKKSANRSWDKVRMKHLPFGKKNMLPRYHAHSHIDFESIDSSSIK